MPRIGAMGAICIVLLLLMPVQAGSSPAQPAPAQFRPGTVLVGVRPSESLAGTTRLLADRDLHVESDLAPLPVVSVNVPAGQEMATVKSLQRTGQVAFAELDYLVHATDVITPNDPGWPGQWGPAMIQAPAAWNIVTGTQVTIAAVDSGIQLSHEDLASQVWTNPGEIPGNGVDDDRNGKVDDVHGWHFYHTWNGSAYIPSEDADVRDDYGHGTHVAGIAAAATNNGVGIAGIAWGARIMPIKVLDEYGNGWYSDIVAGIIYAADNGASIINLSLGGESDSQTLRQAVDYARNRGAVVVAATGNTGGAVLYPAAYEPVLAVAATDADDQHASFSNHGPQVDLSAPGDGIYSTWCHPDPVSNLCLGNYYFTKSGTSMAAPHVAGVAALVRSRWPDLSASAVISTLLETAQDVDEAGFDPFTGWGRVNAYVPTGLWGDLAAPYSVRCDEQFSYTLSYGNDGPQPILSVTLTLELAAGLVSSQPLTQEVGSLPPQSGPLIQQWTAIAPCADLSNTRDYTATATIRGMLAGQPALAHTSRRIVRIVAPLFLPLIFQF